MPPVDVSYIESTNCRVNNQAPNTIIREQMTTVENLGTSFHTIAEAAKTEGFVLMEHTLRLRLYLKGCGGGDPRGVVVRYAGNKPSPSCLRMAGSEPPSRRASPSSAESPGDLDAMLVIDRKLLYGARPQRSADTRTEVAQ